MLRTILHIAGSGLMFSALRYLPLADAPAIAFVVPFVMLLLGYFDPGEAVGAHRLWACTVGFAGTLLVIQPSFAAVGWPALLPVGVAMILALFMLDQGDRPGQPASRQRPAGLRSAGPGAAAVP